MKDHAYIWYLIERRLAGEASPAELEEFYALLAANPGLESYLQDFTTLPFQENKPSNSETEDALARLRRRIDDMT